MRKEIIAEAAAGSADAAKAQRIIDLVLASSRIEAAREEIVKIADEYEKLLETSISKANESKSAKEIRVWVDHPSLLKRFDSARRLLDEVSKIK